MKSHLDQQYSYGKNSMWNIVYVQLAVSAPHWKRLVKLCKYDI